MSGRQHGTRACYVWGPAPGAGKGCRCEPCRDANAAAVAASKRRPTPPYVDATEVREHVADLMAHGVGLRTVAARSGVAHGALSKLIYGDPKRNMGPSKRVTPATRDALLAVKRTDHADGATVAAGPTWEIIDRLLAAGWTKVAIARELGQTGPGLQLSRRMVRARHARAIAALVDKPVPARRTRWGTREVEQRDRTAEMREDARRAAQAARRALCRRKAKIREALERGEDPFELPDLFRAAGEWMRRGACRRPEVPTWLFFPDARDTVTTARAKAVCASCPVQAQCLAAGAGQAGIWGGSTATERETQAVAS